MEALKQFGILVGTVVLATYTVRGIDYAIAKVGTGYQAAKATKQANQAAATAAATAAAEAAATQAQADPGPAAAAAAA